MFTDTLPGVERRATNTAVPVDTVANTVAPAIARSWLLVSGSKPEGFADAAASGADAIVLDVEDAVAVGAKAAARDAVVGWLSGGGRAWVRINDATTTHWSADLDALAGAHGLEGVMLAKAESVAQVAATADRLRPGTPIVALIESAVGLEDASAIARHPSTFRLAFGVGDFRRDTGMGASEIRTRLPALPPRRREPGRWAPRPDRRAVAQHRARPRARPVCACRVARHDGSPLPAR